MTDTKRLFDLTGMTHKAIAEEMNLSAYYMRRIKAGFCPLTDRVRIHLKMIIAHRRQRIESQSQSDLVESITEELKR